MPRVFRSMLREGDRPAVAAAADGLGVRVPPDPRPDVKPDATGTVSAVSGSRGHGMSVAPDWRFLPVHRIPDRLRHLVKGARGKKSLFCWIMGDGPFVHSNVAKGLQLHPDAGRAVHGVIGPAQAMHVDDYQQALAATRPAWTIIPEDTTE